MFPEYPYRKALSEAVLQLQEQGKLSEMKTRWWKEKNGGGACSGTTAPEKDDLSIENIYGVFVVLIVGSIFGSLFGLIEWIFHIWKRAKYLETSFRNEFMTELKFVARCRGHTKIIKKRKSQSMNYDSRHSGRTNRSKNSMTPGGGSEILKLDVCK